MEDLEKVWLSEWNGEGSDEKRKGDRNRWLRSVVKSRIEEEGYKGLG